MKSENRRIWELDALRGFCILWVMVLHLIYDVQTFYGIPLLQSPVMQAVNAAAGISFVLLSGLCVTLGKRPVRRGLQVFGCGMAITAVTWAMAKMGLLDSDFIIRFGVLHLLGGCMLLWPVFRKLPTVLLGVLGVAIIAVGYWLQGQTVACPWLFPLGLMAPGFSSGDYFPLAPFLGWFFLGAVLGRTAYGKKESLLPHCGEKCRFLQTCGRHSLLLYLLHQPVFYGIFALVQ